MSEHKIDGMIAYITNMTISDTFGFRTWAAIYGWESRFKLFSILVLDKNSFKRSFHDQVWSCHHGRQSVRMYWLNVRNHIFNKWQNVRMWFKPLQIWHISKWNLNISLSKQMQYCTCVRFSNKKRLSTLPL